MLGGLVGAAPGAGAQDGGPTRRDFIERYLAPSYVTLGGGVNLPGGHGSIDDLLFEADINQHLHVGIGRRFFVKINPRVRLRMFTEPSSPVRTPSFMPNVTAFFGFGNTSALVPPGGFTFVTVALTHHSNGQAGDFYLPDGSVNTGSGSFSTNFVTVGVNRVWAAGRFGQAWTRLGVVWHPGFNRNDELNDQYERVKLELATRSVRGFQRLAGLSLELRGYVSYVLVGRIYNFLPASGSALQPEPAAVGDRIHATLSASAGRARFGDLRLYLKYDHGFDYYNINFARRLRRIQVGIAGDPF